MPWSYKEEEKHRRTYGLFSLSIAVLHNSRFIAELFLSARDIDTHARFLLSSRGRKRSEDESIHSPLEYLRRAKHTQPTLADKMVVPSARIYSHPYVINPQFRSLKRYFCKYTSNLCVYSPCCRVSEMYMPFLKYHSSHKICSSLFFVLFFYIAKHYVLSEAALARTRSLQSFLSKNAQD